MTTPTFDREEVLARVAEIHAETTAAALAPRSIHPMAGAWYEKVRALTEQLQHIHTAPALFRPEYVAETLARYDWARGWLAYWAEQPA